MPGGDRKGPSGEGPMTGRGAGFCSGSDQPGYTSGGVGRGMGLRRGAGPGGGRRNRVIERPGMGRGGRFGGYGMNRVTRGSGNQVSAVNPDEFAGDEKSALAAQAEILQRELEAIKKRIDSLKDK